MVVITINERVLLQQVREFGSMTNRNGKNTQHPTMYIYDAENAERQTNTDAYIFHLTSLFIRKPSIQGLRFGCIQKPRDREKKHTVLYKKWLVWINRDREAVQWRKGNTVYIVTTAVQGCTKIV